GPARVSHDLGVVPSTALFRSSLREALLAGRRAVITRGGATEHAGETEPVRALARLSTRDLIIAGATASEAGIVAAVLGGALQFVDRKSTRLNSSHVKTSYAGF